MFPANELSENLRRIGIELRRFKTGTPARVHADSLNYDEMEIELGDEKSCRSPLKINAPI